MVQFIVNLIVAVLGLLSVIFGAVGVGVMNTFWRILHIIIGILMVWCGAPLVLDRLLPPKRR